MAIHHTTIKLEILSDGPIPTELTLGDIHRQTIDGDYVGTWSVERTDDWAKRKLLAMGCEPAFFFAEEAA